MSSSPSLLGGHNKRHRSNENDEDENDDPKRGRCGEETESSQQEQPQEEASESRKDEIIESEQESIQATTNNQTNTSSSSSAAAAAAAAPTDNNSSMTLVLDVFSVVLEMLPPRDMLRLSSTCIQIRSLLTYSHVVSSSILKGGHARSSVKKALQLVRQRRIYFPSPLRLLRLAAGHTCELPGCPNTVHTVRPQFGVFACWKCAQHPTAAAPVTSKELHETPGLAELVDHPRTAKAEIQQKKYVWKATLRWGKEFCGPIVTRDVMQEILDANQTMEDFLQDKAFQFDPEQWKLLESLEERLSEKAKVLDSETQRKANARHLVYRRKKVTALENVLGRLEVFLDPRWKSYILKKYWYDGNNNNNNNQQQQDHRRDSYNDGFFDPRFVSSLLQEFQLLKKIIRAPTSISNKKLIRFAKEIDDAIAPIFDNGFATFGCLSDDADEEPFEYYLKQFLQEKYPTTGDFVLAVTPQLKQLCFDKSPFEALCQHVTTILPSTSVSSSFHTSLYDPSLPPPKLAVGVVRHAGVEPLRDTDPAFAELLWSLHSGDRYWSLSFREVCRLTHIATFQAFSKLRPLLLAYAEDPATQEWIQNRDGRNDAWIRVKRREVEQCWTKKEIVQQFLDGAVPDFETLRANHQQAAEQRWMSGRW